MQEQVPWPTFKKATLHEQREALAGYAILPTDQADFLLCVEQMSEGGRRLLYEMLSIPVSEQTTWTKEWNNVGATFLREHYKFT